MSELVGALGRVGVLYGGVSSEREISLASGSAVSESLMRLSIENILIDVADVSRVFSFEIYVAADGSPSNVSTRLSSVMLLTTLSILFVVNIAFIL